MLALTLRGTRGFERKLDSRTLTWRHGRGGPWRHGRGGRGEAGRLKAHRGRVGYRSGARPVGGNADERLERSGREGRGRLSGGSSNRKVVGV
eukprot:852622-Pleurochrysis_carterae.AAC.1